MPAEEDRFERRLALLESNVTSQGTALKALLGAFETLSASLAELADGRGDAPDLVLRVEAIEFRQEQLIGVVRDMHEALGALFGDFLKRTATFEGDSQELRELAEDLDEQPDGAAS